MALRSNGGGRQEAAQARHSSDCLRRICLLHLKRWLSVHPVHCVALSVPYGRERTVRSTLADHPQAGTRSGEKRKMKPHPDPLPVSCQAESLRRPGTRAAGVGHAAAGKGQLRQFHAGYPLAGGQPTSVSRREPHPRRRFPPPRPGSQTPRPRRACGAPAQCGPNAPGHRRTVPAGPEPDPRG